MDATLSELFEQARRIVADHERRQAEREAMLRSFAQTIDSAFDFTAREKTELDPRMDVMEGRGVLQFIVQDYDAIFLLSEGHGTYWGLQAAVEGKPMELLAEIEGGRTGDSGSRRLAAARVICAIGEWLQRHEPAPPQIQAVEEDHSEPEPELVAVSSSAAPIPMSRDKAIPLNGNGHRPPPPVPQFGKSFGY